MKKYDKRSLLATLPSVTKADSVDFLDAVPLDRGLVLDCLSPKLRRALIVAENSCNPGPVISKIIDS